jgi:hypothetical protein
LAPTGPLQPTLVVLRSIAMEGTSCENASYPTQESFEQSQKRIERDEDVSVFGGFGWCNG